MIPYRESTRSYTFSWRGGTAHSRSCSFRQLIRPLSLGASPDSRCRTLILVCPLWAWWEEGGKLEVGKKTDKPKSVELKGAGVPWFASGGLVSPSVKEEAGGLRSPFQPEHPHNMAGFARR